MSVAVTKGVRVEVEPEFLPAQSDPAEGLWVYAYHVTITNESSRTVQLLARHWVITNGEGTEEHVKGPGVVGETPVLRPGQAFRYSSGCPLGTPIGAMHGSYQMRDDEGQRFEVEIAPFTLAEPGSLN